MLLFFSNLAKEKLTHIFIPGFASCIQSPGTMVGINWLKFKTFHIILIYPSRLSTFSQTAGFWVGSFTVQVGEPGPSILVRYYSYTDESSKLVMSNVDIDEVNNVIWLYEMLTRNKIYCYVCWLAVVFV